MQTRKKENRSATGVVEELLSRLLDGSLRPGQRIKEADVVSALGASRTPSREALSELARLGFVIAEPDKGYRVVPLTAREAREIYPLIWTLESLALGESGQFDEEYFETLSSLNLSFECSLQQGDARSALSFDTAWHQHLVSACRNQRLLGMVKNLKLLALRYELGFMSNSLLPTHSVKDHAEVFEALQSGFRERAQELLKEHWRRGMDALLEHLDWL